MRRLNAANRDQESIWPAWLVDHLTARSQYEGNIGVRAIGRVAQHH